MFNLKLAPKRVQLGVRKIIFLGHRVTAQGVEPNPEKIEATTKLRSVRSFLGALIILSETFAADVNRY